MKIVLMCGGIGKRMAPTTIDKALLKYAGKPLIVHQINTAKEAGLSQFVIIANQENTADLKLAVADLKDIDTNFVLQMKPLGMADALLAASDLLSEQPFILVNSNDVFDASAYINLINEYKSNRGYTAYIVAYQIQDYFPGGYLVTNENNEITHIVEKPPRGEEPSNLINIVIHLHNQPEKLFDYLGSTDSTSDDIYERALDRMVHDTHKMKAVVYNGHWQAAKYPWHILDTMDHFSRSLVPRTSPTSHISNTATIHGNVVIEDNVRVFEGAVIRGPSYIGKNSIIGNGALVRDSFIGDDCVIGYGTEIKHSYIGDRCWFHSNYIGDSIIEDDCSFGAGAVTANFRLDEAMIRLKVGNNNVDTGRNKLGAIVGKGCRIGINANIMPGVRIGAYSFVGPQVCLARDLKASAMALPESRYRVLPNKTWGPENKRQELLKKLTG
jgi:bifunctional UDP-N-acetylglucosamine pyrophosphorylase/glucosamine-1-phosphate N-acetyltransferase